MIFLVKTESNAGYRANSAEGVAGCCDVRKEIGTVSEFTATQEVFNRAVDQGNSRRDQDFKLKKRVVSHSTESLSVTASPARDSDAPKVKRGRKSQDESIKDAQELVSTRSVWKN